MDNPESEVVKELRELRTEVEQMRKQMHYTVIGAAVCVVGVQMFPDTQVPLVVSAFLLFALIEPIRLNIFPSKRRSESHDLGS